MRRVTVILAAVCALGGCLASAPAALGSGAQVIADCNSHGNLTRHYTVAELRNALATMSADVKEYTDCYDVIQRALLAGLAALHGGGGDGPGQGSGGSFLPTPLLVLLVLLALAAATLGAVAVRRRAGPPDASSGSS